MLLTFSLCDSHHSSSSHTALPTSRRRRRDLAQERRIKVGYPYTKLIGPHRNTPVTQESKSTCIVQKTIKKSSVLYTKLGYAWGWEVARPSQPARTSPTNQTKHFQLHRNRHTPTESVVDTAAMRAVLLYHTPQTG